MHVNPCGGRLLMIFVPLEVLASKPLTGNVQASIFVMCSVFEESK